MRRPTHKPLVALGSLLLWTVPQAQALYVADGSNCTAACRGEASGLTTTSADISCYDRDYNSTAAGVAFEHCVSCELGSHAFNEDSGQTDLGWAFCMRPGMLCAVADNAR